MPDWLFVALSAFGLTSPVWIALAVTLFQTGFPITKAKWQAVLEITYLSVRGLLMLWVIMAIGVVVSLTLIKNF